MGLILQEFPLAPCEDVTTCAGYESEAREIRIRSASMMVLIRIIMNSGWSRYNLVL